MPSLRARGLIFVTAVLFLAVLAVWARSALLRSSPAGEVHGVRLGYLPSDVRARFERPSAGRWVAAAASGPEGELAMEWTGADPSRGLSARFEFHSGLLVAVRLVVPTTDPAAHGGELEVSTAAVVARRDRGDGRVEVTLLARDCPTHAAEVTRLLVRR